MVKSRQMDVEKDQGSPMGKVVHLRNVEKYQLSSFAYKAISMKTS